MGNILVIGLGSTDISDLTNKSVEKIKNSKFIFSRTKKHNVIETLQRDLDIRHFDSLYERAENIEEVDSLIVEILLKESKDKEITYLVPGSPYVLEKTVELLLNSNRNITIINNPSASEVVLSSVNQVTEGYKTISGKDFKLWDIDFNLDTIIQEIDSEYILDEMMISLSEVYPEESKFSIVKDAGLDTQEIYTDKFKNYSRKISPNHQTSILIYKTKDSLNNFSNLLEITDKLRGPDGCPWDIEQTHESMRQNLLEEAYEAVEAIDNKDYDNLVEELGDVLFQVVFHSQIGYEDGYFSINDVIKSIIEKLIYRHPHVFGDLKLDKSAKVLQNWDSIKYNSKEVNYFWERLNSSKGMPSTIWSYDIIEKVTNIGFDWENKEQILDKVKEEYFEVKEALNDPKHLEEELGDLLFTVVNLSHYLGYEAELLLTKTCDKFVNRFKEMENIAIKEDKDIMKLDTEELEKLWQISKDEEVI